jgi:hypothetical protein
VAINACKILLITPDGKNLLGRPMYKIKDSIKLDYKGRRLQAVDCTHVAVDNA